MNINEAILTLRLHQRWRRGDETLDMQDPKKIGIALDMVLDDLENKL